MLLVISFLKNNWALAVIAMLAGLLYVDHLRITNIKHDLTVANHKLQIAERQHTVDQNIIVELNKTTQEEQHRGVFVAHVLHQIELLPGASKLVELDVAHTWAVAIDGLRNDGGSEWTDFGNLPDVSPPGAPLGTGTDTRPVGTVLSPTGTSSDRLQQSTSGCGSDTPICEQG